MSSKYTRQEYIDYIKLMLTADRLHLEVSDETIGKFVDQALIELQRYIDETKLITVPFAKCIDLTGFDHSAVVHVYRTEGFTGDTTSGMSSSEVDPMYAQTWTVFTGAGAMYNLNNYVLNYAAYNTLLQMRNTMSTDMSFKEDKHANKLYINSNYDKPQRITIEYIPLFKNVEEITSDYWIDILRRLSLALTKVALGRVRSRFTAANSPFTQDGEVILAEGLEELKELREILRSNSNLFLPVD